ncbi:ABC transporter ATP-binding protein [uncultured Oscillibacter sp.]|uniref:ABC transporter ATP-binding protein n=1 Tax=uncultured Oscillibacter sp. TaxID=876091 RepID=UPI0025CFA83F|nr:ABC transporter ATP-binding protein [uncultured Oscillibacter sp.]
MENRIAVELRHIKKHFGPVKANDNVNLKVCAGEIHAILGENGSGKSTLMNVLSGLYAPDGGEILVGGTPVSIRSPKDAILNGIGMIHQHFKLVDALCAWENIVGGMKARTLLRKKRAVAEIMALCEKYGLPLDPEKKVCRMTVGEKQTVEIVKALYRGAEILILDEPTAVLTVQETERLFEILREMKAKGRAVIIITHKLQEVMNVSDRVTVLRKGVSVDSIVTARSSPAQLAELMVGRAVDISVPYAETSGKLREPVLSIRNLHLAERGAGEKLNIDRLDVCACEILGIAGVADSGQRELCESIVGLRAAEGSVLLKGTELIGLDPRAMLRQGIRIGFVPEDRLGMGLASGLSISDNAALRTYCSDKGPFLNKKAEKVQAVRLTERYHVSASGVDQPIQSLSGGNIQKVLLGREIDLGADFFIAAYPVRGLDIGASTFIYEQLNEEKKKGVAILFIGEDLDVLLGICDRIAVLHDGELMGVVDAKTATKEQLGLLMMGQKQEETSYAAN